MKFIIIGKNIDVTPGLREAVESKLGKLGRYFTPNTEIHVTLSVQKGHQKIEVRVVWFVPNRKVLICMYRLIL